MPFKDGEDRPLGAAGIAARAAMVEQAGLDRIWIQDSLVPGVMRPAPLLWLTLAAATTNGAHACHLEAGGARAGAVVTKHEGRRQLSAPASRDGADALSGLPATEGAAL